MMHGPASPSSPGRRGLIKRGLFMVAGGLGLSVAARQGTASAASVPVAPLTRTLTLHGSGVHLYGADRPRGASPLRGDRVAAAGTLHDALGNEAGAFHAAIFCTSSPFSPGAEPYSYLEQHTFTLRDGMLIGMGTSGTDADVFALVGGTGSYLGAKGSYTARQSPFDMGGDGTAEFHFTFSL